MKNIEPSRFIHLLYAPTNFCNMGCKYCYLGTGTDEKSTLNKVVSTLDTAVSGFLAEGIIPFNLSFHGGEATSIPKEILVNLLDYSYEYYLKYGDKIKAAGYPLNPVHIKTNLFNFDKLYDVFERYKVSISGSVDLPLKLHEKYRTDKRGRSTLEKITKNLKLLATYPHHKKISCVVTQEHFHQLDDFIDDIKYIHYGIGLDMTKFNIMFSFDSHKNKDKFGGGIIGTEMLTQDQQVLFYKKLYEEFEGTELEEGLKQHWFKEFTPEFCCSAVNCGDKFFLLQNNGDVYACPRGQSSKKFYYGNLFQDSVLDILNNGWQTIESIENSLPADEECFTCSYLPYCNQGCVFVREQTQMTKSYTCKLQKELYKADLERYPPYDKGYIESYAAQYKYQNKINSFKKNEISLEKNRFITNELESEDNSLKSLLANDPILQSVYASTNFGLTVDGTDYKLTSNTLSNKTELVLLLEGSQVVLKVKRDVLEKNSTELVNNHLILMVTRNTMVTYGDEKRRKQEHLFDYHLYANSLQNSSEVKGDYYHLDITKIIKIHSDLFLSGVRNNFFVTTKKLREYHYEKQRKNAFYHIQAINLPFPFIEFYWQ
ncbi:radical SAM protein [Pseudoalteromonas luteoviolacea]|uniref:radical SAM protein n=1 Tax=Pseudoalteromonas luteoviolacea TaxID=43657 RepID=UPI0009C043D6|nr:SPASM domain-containing protein [Pseudoalteromonas luteoviolacea]